MRHVGAPAIVLQLHLIFAVHGVPLSADVGGVEARGDEELGKAIKAFLEGFRANGEEIVGVVQGRVGVAVPAVAADEIPVAVRIRIFSTTTAL